jgi:hypothetical protein
MAASESGGDALAQERDAFLDRMLQSTRGTFDLFGIYIGVRLGFYEALAAGGPQTSGQLAARTGTAERYAREWLDQQTVAGILKVDDEKALARARRFARDPSSSCPGGCGTSSSRRRERHSSSRLLLKRPSTRGRRIRA